MKIAIDYLFSVFSPKYREGITVYNMFLCDALLGLSDKNEIEFWVEEINKEDFFKSFQFLFDKYPNQVSVLFNKNNFQKVLKKSDADVIFLDELLLKYSHCSPLPKVFMLHDLFTIPLRDLFLQLDPNIDAHNKYFVKNLNLYAKNGAFFVNSSKYIRDNHLMKYVQNASEEKTSVIPFPPMIKKFKENNILSEEIFREKFNISTPYIAYASQNRPNKNLIVLLKALKRLKEKNIKLTLVTTGKIGDVSSTRKYISDNNIEDMIIETGSLSENDLYALYRYSSMVVVPTIIEGLGMSGQCLEALSVGNIPVIHAKSWGIEESLESVGLSMEKADLNWFDLDDDEDLSHKIEDVLKNPSAHIQKQQHILNFYTKRTWEDTAKDYVKVFEKAIENNKKHPSQALKLKEIQKYTGNLKNTKKKFFGFYSIKDKNDKQIIRYFWGLIKKEKYLNTTKIYFGKFRII